MPALNGEPREASTAAWLSAAGVAMLAGLAMSTVPHVVAWLNTGDAVYFADNDDLRFYSSMGAHALHNDLRLSNPATDETTSFPAFVLQPGILVARALGWRPELVNLVWRSFAGVGMGLSAFLLLARVLPRPWMAAALSTLLITDIGLMSGWLFLKHPVWLIQVWRDAWPWMFATTPNLAPHWRIMSPSMGLPFVFLFLYCWGRARDTGRTSDLLWAGAAYGLLFYVYFYFWTAVGLGLWLAIVLDSGSRRTHFLTGVLGTLAGLPVIIGSALMKGSTAPDWLERADMFVRVSRFYDLSWRPQDLALVGILLAWTWLRHRELIGVWCMAVAGLLLRNHQLVTELEIQNWHYQFFYGPCLGALLMLLIASELGKRQAILDRRGVSWGVAVLVGLHFCSGLWLRSVESTRSLDTMSIAANYAQFVQQRRAPDAPQMATRAVVTGDPSFVALALCLDDLPPLVHDLVLVSPSVRHNEWFDRQVVALWLDGKDGEGFESHLRQSISESRFGPWQRDPVMLDSFVARCHKVLAEVQADPNAWLDRFQVRYFVIAHGKQVNARVPWRSVQSGPTWDIWERDVGPRP